MLDDIRNCSTQFVLFGASGDLSSRLIVPALFNLYLDRQLPQHFTLWGIGQRAWQATDLAAHLRQGVSQHSRRGAPPEAEWAAFAAAIRYLRADLTDAASFTHLKELLDANAPEEAGKSERVFYLAVPPALFQQVAEGLGKAGLNADRRAARVVVEKPLGHDLDSFRAINSTLTQVFHRIADIPHRSFSRQGNGTEYSRHALRQSHLRTYLESPLYRSCRDYSRGNAGRRASRRLLRTCRRLRDMVQNHLMQILCLIAMEPPVAYDADDIRGKKMDVLHALRPIHKDTVHEYAARGQYGRRLDKQHQDHAYREEPGIAARSNVETFAAVKLFVDNWRWQGVPFYLRTGKRMAAEVSEVSIRFRDVPHRAFPNNAGLDTQPVRLVIQMNPAEGIVLKFMAKEPGAHWRLRPVDMRFSYNEAFQTPSPAAYETLIRDIILGDATLFMRADQVEAAWKLLQPILEVWEENPAPDFPNYTAGSWGPEAAEALIARDGRNWMTPTLVGTSDNNEL